METLVPALLAVFLSEVGGKTQNFALLHGLANRKGQALLALLLTSLATYAIGAGGGMIVGQMVPYDASSLMFGLALLAAGLPMLVKAGAAPALPEPPSLLRSGFGFARCQFGDAAQFLAFALAARGGSPVLSVLGATLGVLAAALVPIMMGRDWPQGGVLRAMRLGGGILLTVAGFVAAIYALKLTG